MNLLFTICARAGSKGVISKNIRNFLEHPIVYYTLSAYVLFKEKYGFNYENIDLAVNTDSNELITQLNESKIPYIFVERNSELAGDYVSKLEVIKDTLKFSEISKLYKYDIIIDLDLTSPLRTINDIKGVIDKLIQNYNADLSFSVTDSRRLPYFNMVAETQEGFYDVLINKGYVSRQQAPKCYDMNASIYAYRHDFLTTETVKKVFDGHAVVWHMKDTAVLDIDSEEDLELMKVIARYFFDTYEEYTEIYKSINNLV